MGTGYVWHELYGWHDTGSSAGFVYGNAPAGLQPYRHYDSVDSKKRLHELVAVCGLEDDLVRVVPEPATEADLLLVHDRAHVERIAAESRLPGGAVSTPPGASDALAACRSADAQEQSDNPAQHGEQPDARPRLVER